MILKYVSNIGLLERKRILSDFASTRLPELFCQEQIQQHMVLLIQNDDATTFLINSNQMTSGIEH